MRRNLENIEIVEPPIEELTKKRSWKGACFTSCIFLVILGIVSIVAIRVYVGKGPQVTKSVPANFPTDIPIYDRDSIENVTFVPARYKQRGLGIASLLPKLILSPIFYNSSDSNADGTLKNIWSAVSSQKHDYRDSFQIQWSGINADPSFVISYYKKELRKKNFKVDVESEGKKVRQFSFSREDGLDGSVYAQNDDDKKNGTDYMIITVNLPKK
jgi:hypothetical protein